MTAAAAVAQCMWHRKGLSELTRYAAHSRQAAAITLSILAAEQAFFFGAPLIIVAILLW